MKSPLGASDLFAFFLFLDMHFFEPQTEIRKMREAALRRPLWIAEK